MLPFHLLATTGAAALLVIAPAFGQAPARVRGTITGIDHGSVTVTQRDGQTLTLKTGPDTTYAYVVPSSIDAIKVNDFVGSAVKGPPSAMIAVELAIIPENMRAGRISLYDWEYRDRDSRSHKHKHHKRHRLSQEERRGWPYPYGYL
jgi:hypothetical protein